MALRQYRLSLLAAFIVFAIHIVNARPRTRSFERSPSMRGDLRRLTRAITHNSDALRKFRYTANSDNQCRELSEEDRPLNGGLVCHWDEKGSHHCVQLCNHGYDFLEQNDNLIVCGPHTSYQWSFEMAGQALSPCLKTSGPGSSVEADYAYFPGICNQLSWLQQEGVKEELAYTMSMLSICWRNDWGQCSVDDMKIFCGPSAR